MDNESKTTSDRHAFIGAHAALLSAVEIGLGGPIHALHLPFAGHLLSLNQAYMLSRATQLANNQGGKFWWPAMISSISATLKSFTPVGKRLGPMLAISAQGLLYSLPLFFFGPNLLGRLLACAFLSVWAFAQPLLIYYLLFGDTLELVLNKMLEGLKDYIPWAYEHWPQVLLAMAALKIVLSVLMGVLAFIMPQELAHKWQSKFLKTHTGHLFNPTKELHPFKSALKDLFNPFFIFSFLLSGLFILYYQGAKAQILWPLLRPVAIGYFLFLGLRLYPLEAWAKKKKMKSLVIALEKIQKL